MGSPDLTQIFYTMGIIFFIILTGILLWLSIAIHKTLNVVRSFLEKAENTIEDLSFVKEGLKQGIYSLLIRLMERIDNKKRKAGD